MINLDTNMRTIGDFLAGGLWSFSVASLITQWNLTGITDVVQFSLALAGLFYFVVVKIPHEIRMNKQNRKNKHLQNEVLKQEIEDYEEENKRHSDRVD